MKDHSKTDTDMVTAKICFQIKTDMRDNGSITKWMVRENITTKMEISIQVNFHKEKFKKKDKLEL